MTRIPSHTIENAPDASRPSEQLAEAFVSLGLALFTAYFTSYAESPLDLAASAPAPAAARAGQE